MSRSRTLMLPLVGLGFIHIVVLSAGFFGPYDPAAQNRQCPSCPPTPVHWIGPDGRFHWLPFVYRSAEQTGDQRYEEDRRALYRVHLFARGSQYSILGVITSDLHFFGVPPPGHIYLMGTDSYGRDVFSRVLYGGQISLFAGLLATVLSLILGSLMGTVAGFYGGWGDAVIMRCVELFLALPWLYLLLALRAFLPLHTGPRETFLLLIVAIGLVGWAQPARLVRGVVLSTKERSHLLAARGFGASDLYLLRRHVFPETRSVVLTQAALLIPQYVLAEVTLSFLGLGVSEPVPSWGNMLATLQQYHVLVSDWWMFFPGLVLVLVILAYGRLSTALQEEMPQMGVSWNAHTSLD